MRQGSNSQCILTVHYIFQLQIALPIYVLSHDIFCGSEDGGSLLSREGKVVPLHIVNTYKGKRCIAQLILTSNLDGSGWSTPHPSCFTPRERHPFIRRLGGP